MEVSAVVPASDCNDEQRQSSKATSPPHDGRIEIILTYKSPARASPDHNAQIGICNSIIFKATPGGLYVSMPLLHRSAASLYLQFR